MMTAVRLGLPLKLGLFAPAAICPVCLQTETGAPKRSRFDFIQCASGLDEEHCSNEYERCTDHKGIERLRKSHGGPPSR